MVEKESLGVLTQEDSGGEGELGCSDPGGR